MNVVAVMAARQEKGQNNSGFQPVLELAGSGISASKAGVPSCGNEGFHLLLVASLAETLAITRQLRTGCARTMSRKARSSLSFSGKSHLSYLPV